MSDVADRLRALANLATNGLEDTTDVIVRAASMAVARADLGEIAPGLARGYADALDALAGVAWRDSAGLCWCPGETEFAVANPGAEHTPRCQKARAALAAAARLFPEDEA